MCPCLKSFLDSNLKRYRLIALIKGASKRPRLDFVLWFTLMGNILKKWSKLRKEKPKMEGFKYRVHKSIPGSRMELNQVSMDIKWK